MLQEALYYRIIFYLIYVDFTPSTRPVKQTLKVYYYLQYVNKSSSIQQCLDYLSYALYRPEKDLSGRIFIASPNNLSGSSLSMCVN